MFNVKKDIIKSLKYLETIMEEDFIKSLILAKPLLASIDSIIARYSCIRFAKFLLEEAKIITRSDYVRLIKQIKQTSPNAKGYDIDFVTKSNTHIIAELKCYTPVDGNEFGGAQKTAIIRDISGLKTLSKTKNKTCASLTFFAMLCIDKGPSKAFHSLNRSKTLNVVYFKKGISLKTGSVYSVFLEP
jgi:hypothetical protein